MREAALQIIRTLQSRGYEAFIVGGCVRDIILGREPKDFDICTNAHPQDVRGIFSKTIPVGEAFGVVIVLQDGHQIEVATYRADGEYSDGRRPDTVTYSQTAKEDVVRRDFTMNGLLMMPTLGAGAPAELLQRMQQEEQADKEAFELRDGTTCIVDYVGGRKDIENRLIRCIGDPVKRFTEDALRMVRAVRFAAQLGFDIEDGTLKAIADLCMSITKVSRERVTTELFKLVVAPYATRGLTYLFSTGLARYAFPKEYATHIFFEAIQLSYTLERFQRYPPADPLLGIAMLLVDATPTAAEKVIISLKLPNEQGRVLRDALHILPAIYPTSSAMPAEIKRLARHPGLDIALHLFEQDNGIGKATFSREEVLRTLLVYRSLGPEDVRPAPLVTGNDLIAMGHTPGPEFKSILWNIETDQLNGRIQTREEALKYLDKGSFPP